MRTKTITVFLIGLLTLLAFSQVTVSPAVALWDDQESFIAYDMEQLLVNYESTGLQDSWLFDSSIYRNHGEPLPYNTTHYYGPSRVRGLFGYALHFDDDDDYVKIKTADGLPTATITVMGWFKFDSFSSDVRIFNHEQENDGGWLLYATADGYIRFGVKNDSVLYYGQSSALEVDRWYHLTGVYNGTHTLVYVDAVLQTGKTDALEGMTLDSVGDVYIGDTGSNDMNGIADEVKMYPFALTQQEIALDREEQVLNIRPNRWTYYYDDDLLWEYDPTGLVHGHYSNDPTLPYVTKEPTHDLVGIYRYDWVPGFQQYQLKARFQDTTPANTGGYTNAFNWRVLFLKDGQYEVAYEIRLNDFPDIDGTQWRIEFWKIRRGESPEDSQVYTLFCSDDSSQTFWEFDVQSWTTETGRQIALRVSSMNQTNDPDIYFYEHFFDLVDRGDDPRYLEWYDPYVVVRFAVTAGVSGAGIIGISQHYFDITGEHMTYVGEPVTLESETFQAWLPQMNPGEEPNIQVNPNAEEKPEWWDIPGQILWGIRTIASWLSDSLNEAIMGMVSALTVGISILWSQGVAFLDTVFGFAGWSGGFSAILTWITSFLVWTVDGISYGVSFLTSTFLLMADYLVFTLGYFVIVASGLTVVFTNIVWVIEQADAGWFSLTSFITPLLPLLGVAFFVWLFSVKDFEGLVKRVQLTFGLLQTVILFLLKIGSYAFDLISKMINMIPVVE